VHMVPPMSLMFRSPFYRMFWMSINDQLQTEALEANLLADAETARDLEGLRRRVIEQGLVIEELGAMVAVMSKMLIASGQLDAQVLEHRVDAELDQRRAPPVKPAGTCVLCSRQRPGEQLSTTAYGAVCSGGCA